MGDLSDLCKAPKTAREPGTPKETIFGYSQRRFCTWAALRGWSAEDVVQVLEYLTSTPVASVKQFMAWAVQGKIEPAIYADEQVKILEEMVGIGN